MIRQSIRRYATVWRFTAIAAGLLVLGGSMYVNYRLYSIVRSRDTTIPIYFYTVDSENSTWYRDLFSQVTVGANTDQEKMIALNNSIHQHITHQTVNGPIRTGEEVWESQEGICSDVAGVFASLALSAGYPAKIIALDDGGKDKNGHIVVSTYYGGAWHLFDPDYGVYFMNNNVVASFTDIHDNLTLLNNPIGLVGGDYTVSTMQSLYSHDPASVNFARFSDEII